MDNNNRNSIPYFREKWTGANQENLYYKYFTPLRNIEYIDHLNTKYDGVIKEYYQRQFTRNVLPEMMTRTSDKRDF